MARCAWEIDGKKCGKRILYKKAFKKNTCSLYCYRHTTSYELLERKRPNLNSYQHPIYIFCRKIKSYFNRTKQAA